MIRNDSDFVLKRKSASDFTKISFQEMICQHHAGSTSVPVLVLPAVPVVGPLPKTAAERPQAKKLRFIQTDE
jgi:hypothetical protein